ncbi:MAG: hypothetical protein V4613_04780 [Bacteroidota bacterium]
MEQESIVLKSLKMIDEQTVEIVFKDHSIIDVEELKDSYSKLHQFTNGKRIKKLIVSGKFTEITRQAREYGHNESHKIKDKVIAEAMVVHSLGQKMVANFYLRCIKNIYPVKFFTEVQKAKEWLNDQPDGFRN